MKRFICLTLMLVALMTTTGCAIKSPTEWQVAIGTVLFTAFHKGATNLALDELNDLRQANVIDDEQYAHLKELVLKSGDEDVPVETNNNNNNEKE